jgi:hypothetical protein
LALDSRAPAQDNHPHGESLNGGELESKATKISTWSITDDTGPYTAA